MVLAANYLHVVDTLGDFQYKVTNCVFGDISITDSEVAIVECRQNQIMFLQKEKHDNVWEPQGDLIPFEEQDKNTKTLQLSFYNATIFIAVHFSNGILQISKLSGAVLQWYGKSSNNNVYFSCHTL